MPVKEIGLIRPGGKTLKPPLSDSLNHPVSRVLSNGIIECRLSRAGGSVGSRQLVGAGFREAEGDEVAETVSLGCWFTPSSSPAKYRFQSNGDYEIDNGLCYEGSD